MADAPSRGWGLGHEGLGFQELRGTVYGIGEAKVWRCKVFRSQQWSREWSRSSESSKLSSLQNPVAAEPGFQPSAPRQRGREYGLSYRWLPVLLPLPAMALLLLLLLLLLLRLLLLLLLLLRPTHLDHAAARIGRLLIP